MGLDSLDLIVRIEKEFGFQMLDAEAEAALTVGNMQKLVWCYIQNRDIMTEDKMKTKLTEIISDQLGFDIKEITPEKYFVKDLGIDK